MTSDPQVVSARVLQILDSYDFPELVLLEGPSHIYTLAVRSVVADACNVYVGGSMSAKRLRDYASGKCDLRYAIAHASARSFWRFTFNVGDELVDLQRIKRSDEELRSSIPDHGLFAYDHEDISIVKSFVPNSIEKFNVDGGWDLGEFSYFYSQIEDIYYISSDMDRFSDPNVTDDEKKVIMDAFERPWNGGGSYVAFYKKVANDNDFHAPLRVSGIQYNSPGYVSVHARAEPFNNLMGMLQHFAVNEAKVKKAANALGRFMSRGGMKKRDFTVRMMKKEDREKLGELATKFSEEMPHISFNTIWQMTGHDVLIAAKVVESIFRRIERLYKFFDEGRVAHPKLKVY